jgi:hypothetical protein
MDEGTARFWATLFGGITAISLVAGGAYTLLAYLEGREKDRAATDLQIATATLAAKQGFNSKHFELCAQAAGDAGTISTSKDESKKRLARDDFWRLHWGPLGIVEESEVAKSIVSFGHCLNGTCDQSMEFLALDLAHACRAEVSKDFQVNLPTVPKRPPED